MIHKFIVCGALLVAFVTPATAQEAFKGVWEMQDEYSEQSVEITDKSLTFKWKSKSAPKNSKPDVYINSFRPNQPAQPILGGYALGPLSMSKASLISMLEEDKKNWEAKANAFYNSKIKKIIFSQKQISEMPSEEFQVLRTFYRYKDPVGYTVNQDIYWVYKGKLYNYWIGYEELKIYDKK